MNASELLEKDIISKLPQIPFIIDQVGAAMAWAKEEQEEGRYYETLKFVKDVADYTEKVSIKNFYKTHLVIAALLMDIEDPFSSPKFDIFRTTSGTIEETVRALKVNEQEAKERGCFKAISLHLSRLAQKSDDLLVIMLYAYLNDLQTITSNCEVLTPITPEDYIKVLGYSFAIYNLKHSNFPILNSTYDVLNKILIILNKIIY